MPGSAFLRPADEWTVRLCFVDFDGDPLLAKYGGDDVITVAAIEKHAPNIKGGIDRLKQFVIKYSK